MDFSYSIEFPENKLIEWNTLIRTGISHSPFLRYEYLKNWWRTRGGGEWKDSAQLLIVTAEENGRTVGIAPMFIADNDGKKELLFLGSIEISDYLDFLVQPKYLASFVEGLITYTKERLVPEFGIEAIDLYNLLDQSPTMRALQNGVISLGVEAEFSPLVKSPYIPLPGSWDEYLEIVDKKQRHEIRRKMRRMLEIQPPADWYIAADAEKIDEEIQDFLRLMTYEKNKEDFLTPAMRDQMTSFMRDAFDSGILQLAFLTIGGEKAAACLNLDYMNRIWLYNSGLDPRFSEHSPGWVLLGHLLKWANENGRFEFDFMRGNEDYKYRFGAIDRMVIRARISL